MLVTLIIDDKNIKLDVHPEVVDAILNFKREQKIQFKKILTEFIEIIVEDVLK